MSNPKIGLVMGSKSDWSILEHTADMLTALKVPFETKVVSAHRTPDLLFQYADEAKERGLRGIIAGAGGAAHLPGMLAAKTTIPVLGVPIEATSLQGMDSLLSIVQMPGGVPVATFSIGKPGAINAALFAAAMLADENAEIQAALDNFRQMQTKKILDNPDPRGS